MASREVKLINVDAAANLCIIELEIPEDDDGGFSAERVEGPGVRRGSGLGCSKRRCASLQKRRRDVHTADVGEAPAIVAACAHYSKPVWPAGCYRYLVDRISAGLRSKDASDDRRHRCEVSYGGC
jgi:hypothetical protein